MTNGASIHTIHGRCNPQGRARGQSSLPGGGEDKDVNGTADREPDDAEDGDTAR
jgi:hypothetical protein